MSAPGTIFYRWTGNNEREAFEAPVDALGLELDDVRPALFSEREPVRFWVHEDARSRMRELSRYHGVADSTVFRLIFEVGFRELEHQMREATGESDAVRYPTPVCVEASQ